MLDLQPYLRRPLTTFASIASDPMEAWVRFREQVAAHREGFPTADLYKADDDWEQHLHKVLDLTSTSAITAEFWDLWSKVIGELDAKGIKAGPSSFKGWNDGDAAFVRAIWCMTRQLQPKNVVETGVAHGVTSRFILEALERNGSGHLWSIDRPPIEPEWQEQIAIAVDDRLKHRWSYILGSSRRRLPSLVAQLGQIDLFVHDSLHSARNVRFEMDQAWAVLRPGGAIIVDDIDTNRGFQSFTQSSPGRQSLVCEAEPLRPDPRRFNKKGMFGIIFNSTTK